MKFKFPLYHYQEDVLDVFHKEIDRWDTKIHIVAPPWSWKTIMWLEMISRLEWNHLILVPNLTLQYQWKDKIEKFFLEQGEEIDKLVSTTTKDIKKINIITYQSLTSSNNNNDLIMDQIINYWFEDIKSEFKDRSEFTNYIEVLKDLEAKSYMENISKYKKRLKTSNKDNVEDILSKKVLDYFQRLQDFWITSIVVDEAHHLTSWWSKVIYKLWKNLGERESHNPFIIWLTATPPYDDIDFFILDDDYVKLLWEVDYYIPTPAVVKSGRLAPWSDLVYFVEADDSIKNILKENDKKLDEFINKYKEEICNYLYKYLEENYNNQLNKSYKVLINYIKFIKNFSDLNIQEYYFDEKIWDEIWLEDIAKSVWKYMFHIKKGVAFKKEVKELFYNLWYIYRGKNFYKFRTPIENMLIYSQSKINGIKDILNKEISNIGNNLKSAIITDYLEERDGIISCKYILKNLLEYKKYNPILVSWKWIWKLSADNQLLELDTDILKVTEMLESGETNIVIWTRWMLWEWWDCPSLNVLIDLTGIVAYMSVNQVRGRAIRLDPNDEHKVANIYDIVTITEGYKKWVDLYRLRRKHEKFYGVDDSGLIIRGVDHIYPNLEKHIWDYKKINQNILLRSENREFYYSLWGIGGNYQNKEVFGLDIEINEIWKYIPFVNFRWYDSFKFFNLLKQVNKLEELDSNNYYFQLIDRFLNDFITNIKKSLITTELFPEDFHFELILSKTWTFKLISNYKDELIVKQFMLIVSEIFWTVVKQKYVCRYPFAYFNWTEIEKAWVNFPLSDSLCNNKLLRSSLNKEIINDRLYKNTLINYMLILTYIARIWEIILLILVYIYLVIPLINNYETLTLMWVTMIYMLFISLIVGLTKLETNISKSVNYFKEIYMLFTDKKDRKYKPKFVYLKSPNVDKDHYIWKKTFIEAKIEKLWM